MSSRGGVQRVTMQPDPATWAGGIARAWNDRSGAAQRFRTQLGVPTDKPIIMTGHQPAFWHPGILAKYIAADRLARQVNGVPVAVIVDHDTGDVDGLIDRPATEPGGALRVERVDAIAAGLVDELHDSALIAHCTDDVARIVRMNEAALARWYRVTSFSAHAVMRTDLAAELIGRMGRDPIAAAEAYNAALQRHPGAGVRLLRIAASAERTELPLWWIAKGGARRPVLAGELSAPPPGARLAPRALLLTALLRLAGCELFIHGTGGGAYDPAAATWMTRWHGAQLAPMATVSADVTLPLEVHGPSLREISGALWREHRARHDPALLGATSLGDRKRDLAGRIAQAASRAKRASLFAQMHEGLATYRHEHAEQLDQLARQARDLRAQAVQAKIAERRDWPAILHPQATLDELARAVEALLIAADRPADVSSVQ